MAGDIDLDAVAKELRNAMSHPAENMLAPFDELYEIRRFAYYRGARWALEHEREALERAMRSMTGLPNDYDPSSVVDRIPPHGPSAYAKCMNEWTEAILTEIAAIDAALKES